VKIGNRGVGRGIDAKEVAIPLPRFVLRVIDVKSTKPPGVNFAFPISKYRGDAFFS
jgi:hypothetical protein